MREDALKDSLKSVERGLRDVKRSVQLVRDKQELAEAHAELAKVAMKNTEEAGPPSAPPSATAAQVHPQAIPAVSSTLQRLEWDLNSALVDQYDNATRMRL